MNLFVPTRRDIERFFVALLATTTMLPALATTAARELDVAVLAAPAASASAATNSESTAVADLNEALVREICQRIAARCKLHGVPFADILPGVERGRFQIGMGNVLYTPERAAKVRFSGQLWRASSRLIGAAGAIQRHQPGSGKALSLDTLRNASVIVVKGSQQAKYVRSVGAANGLKIVEVDTLTEAFANVRDGKAEFSLLPVRGAYFQLAAQESSDVAFVGPALTRDGLGGTVHLILPRHEAALAENVDRALAAMRADGTYLRIVRRYMPFLAD